MSKFALALHLAFAIASAAAGEASRERISIDAGWRFTQGDPTSFELFQSHDRQVFDGCCLVIVRAKTGSSGKIKLVAKADGIAMGTVSITAR